MIGVVFPGQGSQKPRMGEDLYRNDTFARQVFDQIEQATNVNVALLCFESDESVLKQTQNAQLALYACGLAAYYALREAIPGLEVKGIAGHSVGEYTALAAAGMITVAEGATLVKRRSELMAGAGKDRPGTMAAVIGLDAEELQHAVNLAGGGVCVIANDNCPGQLVISGEIDAVQAASVKCGELGAKRVIPLQVSGAFHSPLMDAASEELGKAIDRVHFSEGGVPVYSNVTAEIGKDWPPLLKEQLKSRVRWCETVEHMKRDGITTYVECGSGEVLTGLLRRIDKDAKGLVVVDSATLAETFTALGGAA